MVDLISDVLRWMNVALALYVLVQCLRPASARWWSTRPAEVRFLLLGMIALVLAAGWGTAESLAAHLPGGTRVPPLTIALAWTAIGATLLHHRIRKDPTP